MSSLYRTSNIPPGVIPHTVKKFVEHNLNYQFTVIDVQIEDLKDHQTARVEFSASIQSRQAMVLIGLEWEGFRIGLHLTNPMEGLSLSHDSNVGAPVESECECEFERERNPNRNHSFQKQAHRREENNYRRGDDGAGIYYQQEPTNNNTRRFVNGKTASSSSKISNKKSTLSDERQTKKRSIDSRTVGSTDHYRLTDVSEKANDSLYLLQPTTNSHLRRESLSSSECEKSSQNERESSMTNNKHNPDYQVVYDALEEEIEILQGKIEGSEKRCCRVAELLDEQTTKATREKSKLREIAATVRAKRKPLEKSTRKVYLDSRRSCS